MKTPNNMHQPGNAVMVRSSFGGYKLPEGLPEGSQVKIVSRDPGYYDVEHDGKQFRVAFPCVEF